MEQERYITEEQSVRCKRVADAFAELYEESDIVVLDAGRYGFVELQYFRAETGFNSVMVFADSRKLFDDLWECWMDVQLLKIVSGTPMEEKDYEDIFKWLPKDKQEEIMAKQKVFASRAGVDLDVE